MSAATEPTRPISPMPPPRRACRRWPLLSRSAAAGLAVLSLALPAAANPRQPATASITAADATLEAYLERLGLRTLLADHLTDRLKTTVGPERTALAERLS